MRSTFLGLLFGIAQVFVASGASASDPSAFEIMGLRLEMTLDQVKQVLKKQELGSRKLLRAPSFEQEIALARKERVAPSEYKGVQTLRAGNGHKRVQIFFVAMPKQPVTTKITVEVFGGTSVEEFSETLVSKYGPPERKSDREWLWGDTNIFYARTKPSLEFQPNPVSATSPKPIFRVVLADPSIEKAAKDAIAAQARQ